MLVENGRLTLVPHIPTIGRVRQAIRTAWRTSMASPFFRRKSPDLLIQEAAAPERMLKRVLGPFQLTCIGIGAIIGAGIFALAGTAAAGEQAQVVGSIWKTPVLNFIQS